MTTKVILNFHVWAKILVIHNSISLLKLVKLMERMETAFETQKIQELNILDFVVI